jgi:hypothetical protein
MAYTQSPINFGVGTGSSPLNKNGDPKKEKSDTQKKFENTNYDQMIYNMSGTYNKDTQRWSTDDTSKHSDETIHAKSDKTKVAWNRIDK